MLDVRHPRESIFSRQIIQWFKCLNVFLKFFGLLLTLHLIPLIFFTQALIKRDTLSASCWDGGRGCACINTENFSCRWLTRTVFDCHDLFLLVSCHRTLYHLAFACHNFEVLSVWNTCSIRLLAFFAVNTGINSIVWDQQWIKLRPARLKKFI